MSKRASVCPFCGANIIEGEDTCESCGHSLTDMSKPRARSTTEQRIVSDRIRVLSPRPPIVVEPQTKVGDVLDLLVKHRIGCVIVAQNGKLLGIFSERDALMRLNVRFEDLSDRPISEFATMSVETLSLDDKIAFALHRMDLGGYRHIPILSEGELVGVISIRDILRYISEHILAA